MKLDHIRPYCYCGKTSKDFKGPRCFSCPLKDEKTLANEVEPIELKENRFFRLIANKV